MSQKSALVRLVSAARLSVISRAVAIVALGVCLPVGTAVAAPDYYNMLNGGSGSYTYWDESYDGSGSVTCNYCALTGGSGDLTDGFIATSNWYVAEVAANGPYVGWQGGNPTITFHWNSPISINSVTFYFDDSNNYGGVMPPASVVVNGLTYTITDSPLGAPFAFTASGVDFNNGTDLAVTINSQYGMKWIFLSEVEFNGVSNVSEPGTLALLGLGLAGLATIRRRKQ
jgi:hypothetical protein